MTSVDLWVAAARAGIGTWLRGAALPKLEPADFELRVDGRVVKVVAVATPAEEPSPHRIVVFFDAPTNDQASFRWAASRLAERAAELASLGEVEVVVADPDPRVVMAATRDATRLAEALASLSLFAGTDAAIPLLRDQFLAENEEAAVTDDVDDDVDDETAARFLREETALVVRRQDLLLRHLIDREPSTRAGRVLIYVSQGFDPRPERFYLSAATHVAGLDEDGSDDSDGELELESRAWVEALAAHGWTCLPLVYEDRRALLRRGFRIGKWRFHRPGGGEKGPMILFGASYEGERDAETAEALLELGDGALARGSFDAAIDAYLRAIHRFYGDPRTQERQAYTWRQLALALRGAGEIDRARQAMANAIELDPSIERSTDAGLTEIAASTRDVEGLSELASETGGTLLRDGEGLAGALDAIARRQRLTFTLEGAATGRVLPLALSGKRGGELAYGRWTRSGTPERVAKARLRLFLDETAVEPDEERDLVLSVADGEEGDEGAGRETVGVTIAIEQPDPARATRVAIGILGEEGSQRVAALTASPPALWRGEIDLANDEILAAAVYVEDLGRGEWSVEPVTVESAAGAP